MRGRPTWASACGNLFPAPGKRNDLPVSQRTPAKARMRRSRTVTSRSTDRQRDKRRWLSSGKAVKSPGLLQDAKSAAWPIRRGCFACRRFYRTESVPVTKSSRQDPASGLPKSKSWLPSWVRNREIDPDLIRQMTGLCRILRGLSFVNSQRHRDAWPHHRYALQVPGPSAPVGHFRPETGNAPVKHCMAVAASWAGEFPGKRKPSPAGHGVTI